MCAFANEERPDARLFLCLTVLAALLSPLCASADPNLEPAVAITNLHDLQRAVATTPRCLCDLDLEADICAADAVKGALALRDNSGVEVCELDLAGQEVFAGEHIRLRAARCELIRHQWSVAIAAAPVVDNRGVHAVEEKSGSIHLAAGRHPLRLFYFNANNPAELEVSYSGPEIPQQPVPSSSLFLEPTNAADGGSLARGLRYFCYDETPATLDDVRDLPPTLSGVAPNFDIGLREPEESVAMQFRGLLDVPRSGEYVFTVRSDDGSELYIGGLGAEIGRIASNAPPVAAASPFAQEALAPDACGWATVEGRVVFVGREADGLQLQLQDGNHSTRVWIANPEGVSRPLLLNARVRATGVFRRLIDSEGQNNSGMISVVAAENFRLLGLAAELWDKYPVTSILHALGERLDNDIVHLRGRLSARPNGEFLLDDGSGRVPVNAANTDSFTDGAAIEVLGEVVGEGTGAKIRVASSRGFAASPPELPTLTTAAQVQELSDAEAARHYPVRIRGVVTCVVEWSGAVAQDDTRGVFFDFENAHRNGLQPGDFVEISGLTAVGDFAPVITAQSLAVLGRGQMPEAAHPNWNQLISGSLDSQYAEVRGIITDVEGNKATLLTDGGKIKAVVSNTGETALRRLQNTLVRIRGCLFAEWDGKTHQVRVGEIKFRNAQIEVEQLPMSEPFTAPAKTISDLLRFDLHASGFQRVKVSGQIVHVRGNEFFLMQGGRGLRFRPSVETALQAGDIVDVVGIPDLSGPSPMLHEAAVRKTGSAALPPPAPWQWTDADDSTQGKDAILVQTEARLIGLHHSGPEWALEAQTGLRAYRVVVKSTRDLAREFPLNSRLQLTGVYALQNGPGNDKLAAMELLLNSPEDIKILERPPWWNLRRLLFILATLVAGLVAAVVWISQLRRKVEQRTKLLEHEYARREHAERERALEFERSRIARDLHDDLGSSLTEIHVMASSGLRSQEADLRSRPIFTAIAGKAHSLVSALDVIVWAVDPEANSLQSLADYLSSYAADYLDRARINHRFKIPMSLPTAIVDGRTRHEVFLAVKESLHNVVQHSGAREVEFRLRAGQEALEIEIIDDGCGFDLNTVADRGHGLKNISERLARLSGSGRLSSQPGHGATVTIRLPLFANGKNGS